MTIDALHKLTGQAIANGLGRRNVCINKSTFQHPLESDGACILHVCAGGMETFGMLDENGGRAERKDGQTITRLALVLKGQS